MVDKILLQKTDQTRNEHIQFNLELGQQQQLINLYERNVKSKFPLWEEFIKQFGTFSYDLIKYENYAKDVPDERCNIMILAMLTHDLLFAKMITLIIFVIDRVQQQE